MKYGWYCRDFRQFPESSLHHVWSHTQRILAGGGASSYWEGKPLVCHLDQHQWFKFAHCQLFFVRISMYFVYIIIIDSVDTLSSSRANQGRKFQRGKSYKPKKEFAYRMCARRLHGCCEMSCHVISCHVTSCDVIWCDVISSCDLLSFVVKWCDAMGWDFTSLWCDVAGCEVTLCGSKRECDVENWKVVWWSLLQSTKSTTQEKVLPSTTPYYKLSHSVVQNKIKYYVVLQDVTRYYSALQSATPFQSITRYYKVLLRTTKYYNVTRYYKVQLRTTKHYNVLHCATKYFSVLQSTSSTARGGGGSFKNRKPIGEIGCCE